MNPFIWNLMLALIWAALTGSFSPANLLIGFLLAYFVLNLMQGATGKSSYYKKMRQLPRFLIWFTWELVVSNLRVASVILTPKIDCKAGMLALPLDAQTPMEITLFANLITLTPGTLSIDVSDDQKTLYIHAMFIDDPEELRRDLKDGLERRLLELLR